MFLRTRSSQFEELQRVRQCSSEKYVTAVNWHASEDGWAVRAGREVMGALNGWSHVVYSPIRATPHPALARTREEPGGCHGNRQIAADGSPASNPRAVVNSIQIFTLVLTFTSATAHPQAAAADSP